MAHASFRFLHGSDLQLERPLGGVTEVPDHLRELFLEAPYRAAEQVFDAAIAAKTDFLLLTGDVLDPTLCGPRGLVFLIEQFERLAAGGIAVYWAGEVDWPTDLPLPSNVHHFPEEHVEHIVHHRHGQPVCNLLGRSGRAGRKFAPADFRAAPSDLFNIAVTSGQPAGEILEHAGISYWALGGRSRRTTRSASGRIAHDPGTPQGRDPRQVRAHGCTLVEVDAADHISMRRLTCDAARWHTLEIRVDEHTQSNQLDDLLEERLLELKGTEGKLDLLISWQIIGAGPLFDALRRGSLAAETLHRLRDQFSDASPSAWSVSLRAMPPDEQSATIANQETLLGDYVRRVCHYQTHPQESLVLTGGLDSSAHEIPAAIGRLKQSASREHVLREAAALGIQLLQGGEA